jgi:hypothetical protein
VADQQRRAPFSEHKAPLQDPARGSTSNLGEDDAIQNLKGRVLKPIKQRVYPPLNRIISRLGYIPCLILLLALTGASAVLVKED